MERVSNAITAHDGAALRELVADLHEADLGALLQALEQDERDRLIRLMGNDFDWLALTEVDDTVRSEILEAIPNEQITEAVRELDSDDAVEIIADLDKEDREEVLAGLPYAERIALERRLDYPEEFGRPAHDLAVHRGAAVLDRRADDRLHARGIAAAG